jgi:AcrR family transcriptional regulator
VSSDGGDASAHHATTRPLRNGDPTAPSEDAVLRRGLTAFAELGYDGTSVRELAGRLGVSHNFINTRYGSKAGFWRAVVDHALPDKGHPVPESAADDVDRIRVTVTNFYRHAARHPELSRMLTDEFSRDSDRLDYLYEHYVAPTVAAVAPSVDRLVAAGRLAPIPMHLLYFAVVGPVAGLTQTPLARHLGRPEPAGDDDLTEIADALTAVVLNGLLPAGR